MRNLVLAFWLGAAYVLSPLNVSMSKAETTLSQVEYDLLKARLGDQLKKLKFERALDSISRIKRSGYKYSPTLIYFEGYAFKQLGKLTDAKSAFLGYLDSAGSKGKYYQKSLQNIVDIDDRLDGKLQQYTEHLATPGVDVNSPESISLEKALGDKAIPVRQEYNTRMAAKKVIEQERLAEEARIAEEIIKNPPKIGTITSIDTVWDFVVIGLDSAGLVKSGDIVKAKTKNNSFINLTIKKISNTTVSATVDGEISIIQIGMNVHK